ncbi:hypothetical protein VRU48_01335 [Pedobacter sp. KR3-3]|uniref:DUF4369 domain-containing protein n=1 Tax=Pedobacter albus TaxID=3113905 RepID=A0ABU7I2P3_9SPHI|nr:hypothetical protein [Pedobacter sp. KR3-3]MEE1943730.1 hypothetical protein [Pedobacter sp. KR3-3]
MRTLFILAFIAVCSTAKAQIKPTSGQYTTADGYYTVTINFENSSLTLIEPNRTSVYTKVADNIFSFIHPASKIDYRIEVMDPQTIQTFKANVSSSRYTLKLSSTSTNTNSEQYKTYSAMAERYKAKMLTDKKDAQLWSFCAAAAYARSTMNDEGFKEYATQVSSSIKLIIVNKTKCPCEDAIPATIWNNAQ